MSMMLRLDIPLLPAGQHPRALCAVFRPHTPLGLLSRPPPNGWWTHWGSVTNIYLMITSRFKQVGIDTIALHLLYVGCSMASTTYAGRNWKTWKFSWHTCAPNWDNMNVICGRFATLSRRAESTDVTPGWLTDLCSLWPLAAARLDASSRTPCWSPIRLRATPQMFRLGVPRWRKGRVLNRNALRPFAAARQGILRWRQD